MPDARLADLPLSEAAELIRRHELSPVELAQAVLARIDALDPRLNAFTTRVPADDVLAGARAAERDIARGQHRGPLHGIPVSVKDLIDTAGLRTTYGSGMFRDHVPAVDGAVPARLRAALVKVPQAALKWRPAPGEWSAHEVIWVHPSFLWVA